MGTGNTQRYLDAICADIELLNSMPYQALHLAELGARRCDLERIALVLDRMQRFASPVQQRSVEHLRSVWQAEWKRLQDAETRPVVAVSALAALEATWLSRHPYSPLDTSRRLVVILTYLENMSLRLACKAFSVASGSVEGSGFAAQFDLLVAPAWFAEQLPIAMDATHMGLRAADAALRLQVDVSGFTDDEVELAVALFEADVRAELFHLPRVVAAVEALRALDAAPVRMR